MQVNGDLICLFGAGIAMFVGIWVLCLWSELLVTIGKASADDQLVETVIPCYGLFILVWGALTCIFNIVSGTFTLRNLFIFVMGLQLVGWGIEWVYTSTALANVRAAIDKIIYSIRQARGPAEAPDVSEDEEVASRFSFLYTIIPTLEQQFSALQYHPLVDVSAIVELREVYTSVLHLIDDSLLVTENTEIFTYFSTLLVEISNNVGVELSRLDSLQQIIEDKRIAALDQLLSAKQTVIQSVITGREVQA